MTPADAFQSPPLCALSAKIAPGSTQCLIRSTDDPLKPKDDNISINTGYSQADRAPLYTKRGHSPSSTWTSQTNTKPSQADGAPLVPKKDLLG